VRVVEYDASRRADVADLLERVWGERTPEDELAWLYERNPVRPASVLLAEEDERVVGSVALAFARMAIAGEDVEVGMPIGLATDPAYRGRGIFAQLQAMNEQRARDLGVRLLFTVPTEASTRILVGRLDWTPLPSLRVWVRPRVLRGPVRARRVERFSLVTSCHKEGAGQKGGGDRVLRDTVWLNWRFADAPRPYELLERDGYAVLGRRGRVGVLGAVDGDLLAAAAAAAREPLLIAAPPPWELGRYALAGYVPTPRTFTLLGKSLDRAQRLPQRPHFELGDLDFF
jgi:GNAT superfamily N-acetyltransferase